jgi:UDP-glucose 4-epimerase
MRIAILGGTGLIGLSTALRLIEAGIDVTVISRRKPAAMPFGVKWLCADIADREGVQNALQLARPDRVAHLAGYLQFGCEQNPAEAIRVNISGTSNVLESCHVLGIRRVVFGSSIAVYGERHDTMQEEDPLPRNVNLYGVMKRLCEVLGERYQSLYGMEFVALRYSGVFGPSESQSPGMALVRYKIKQCALGHDVRIDGAGGSERIHLTYVTDAANATFSALMHPAPSYCIYNVAGPAQNYLTLSDFHGLVCSLVPSAGKAIWSGCAKSAGPLDTTRLQEDLKCVATVSVYQGLLLDLDRHIHRISNQSLPPSNAQVGNSGLVIAEVARLEASGDLDSADNSAEKA